MGISARCSSVSRWESPTQEIEVVINKNLISLDGSFSTSAQMFNWASCRHWSMIARSLALTCRLRICCRIFTP